MQPHAMPFYSALFWLTLLLHACFWTFAPAYFIPNYRLDTLEMMVIGQHWVLTTFKHPALQAWVVEVLSQIFHRAEFVPFLAGQIAAVLSVWGIWKLAQKILPPHLALIAALAMLSYSYFNFDSTMYNNRTFMRAFWILAVYFFYCALEQSEMQSGKNYRYWILTGLMLGLGLLCKLTVFILVFCLLVFMVWDPKARKCWKTAGPYLSTGVCFLMFLPLLIWLYQTSFSNVSYAYNSVGGERPPLFNHVLAPLRFALSQLFSVLPVLIPLIPILGFRWKFNGIPNLTRFNIRSFRCAPFPAFICSGLSFTGLSFSKRFVLFFVFFPFIVQLGIAAVLGGDMRTALGCHIWTFLPICLLSIFQINTKKSRTFQKSMMLVYCNMVLFALLGVLIFSLGPLVSGKGSREHFPGRDLAETVESIWEERFHTPLLYVRGDDWPCENVSVYGKVRPELFSELWSTEADFAEKGGILLWMESVSSPGPEGSIQRCYGNADFGYSLETGKPEAWLAQFPDAEILPPLILPKQTFCEVPPAKIGIALVPPKRNRAYL